VVKLFVEGGGDSTTLKTECREGFTKFITAAGVQNRPRVVACGTRGNAYDSYRTAIQNGEEAILLVDAEAPIIAAHENGEPDQWTPWLHLKNREGDEWEKPKGAEDTDCHFMAQIMESWFISDHNTLKSFYGASFKTNKLPPETTAIETIAKLCVYKALKEATSGCAKKGKYGKGSHSFKLLGAIDPNKVMLASPWAKRFIDELKKKMAA
jgi:Domain of unknown function (DUF4276)